MYICPTTQKNDVEPLTSSNNLVKKAYAAPQARWRGVGSHKYVFVADKISSTENNRRLNLSVVARYDLIANYSIFCDICAHVAIRIVMNH